MKERKFEARTQRWAIMLSMIIASGLLLTGLVGSASAAPQRGGRVEGTIVSADTGTPLSGVEVWLDRVADPDLSPRRRATTDEAGLFVFTRVHPGNYRLYARKTGYLLTDYLQQQKVDSQNSLMVEAGMTVSNIQIGLPTSGKVSGIVLSDQGQPEAGVIVKLLALNANGQDVSTSSVVTTQTDKTGQYTLQDLQPGHYVLRAERRNVDQVRAQLEFAYYPDGESVSSATPIEIGYGEAVTDVNVTFTPHMEQPVITGSITDSATGQPLAGVSVDLVDGSNLGLHAKTGADGIFRLEGMPSGHYTISAHGEAVGDGYEWMLTKTSVEPGMNVLDFQMTPSPKVIATVEYIGAGKSPAPGDYMVSVRVDNNARGVTYNGQETYEFRGLKAGKARIGVGFASLQYKLAGVLVNGQDVMGRSFELHPGDKLNDVRILITDDSALNTVREK